jgi:GT2 family glycosyltransferase
VRDVLLAYVHPGGPIEHSFHVSMMDLLARDAAFSRRLYGVPSRRLCGAGGLPGARNHVMAAWLNGTDIDWLFMVDTDMGFQADVLDRLLAAADPVERPVVGALCFSWVLDQPDGYGGYTGRPSPTLYGWDGAGFRAVSKYPRDELVRVAGTGAACLLVHRDAAGKVRAAGGDDWFTPVRYPDGRFVSEDLSFCYRLGEQSIPVHVHTGIRTTHAKRVWVGEPEWLDWQARRG